MEKCELIDKIKNLLPYDHKIEIGGNSILSIRKSLFQTTVCVSPVFLNADDNTIIDIVDFIKKTSGNKNVFKKNDYNYLRDRLSKFYENNRKQRNIRLIHKSKSKNLLSSFGSVVKIINGKYPEVDTTPLKISWGRKTSKRYRTIRFGSFDQKNKLIRIHPVCDSEKIPDFFFRSVIFHEAAHYIRNSIHLPGGIHDRKFHEILKRIDNDFMKSKVWEKNNIDIFFDL